MQFIEVQMLKTDVLYRISGNSQGRYTNEHRVLEEL